MQKIHTPSFHNTRFGHIYRIFNNSIDRTYAKTRILDFQMFDIPVIFYMKIKDVHDTTKFSINWTLI